VLTRRTFSRGILAATSLGTLSRAAFAQQDYPTKQITVTIGLAAGSGADILTRHFTTKMAELAAQPVVVQNKPGAFNAIAANTVAKARPDGYNVLFTGSAIIAGGRHLVKDLPFDGVKELTPVAVFAESPFLLCVGKNSPYNSIAELVTGLKSKPQATFGFTSPTAFISTAYFNAETGIKPTAVAYKTAADALPDVENGTLDFVIFDGAFVVGQIKGGRIRALAATSAKRINAIAEIPTMQEAGLPKYNFSPWWGVYVPTGTPQPIVDKLSKWINQIAAAPETIKFVESIANVPATGDAAAAAALLKSDTEKWDELAKVANLQPQ
jgi:tripartite-type tricarboxylate transporter receptor subunit TctC